MVYDMREECEYERSWERNEKLARARATKSFALGLLGGVVLWAVVVIAGWYISGWIVG